MVGPEAGVHYRDGLIIALLAYRPVRMRNLAAMRLGQHLIKLGDRYWLVFAASETKSRQPYEAPFPDSLVSALDPFSTEEFAKLAATAS